MTLNEAIWHCQGRAKADCSECAEEHRQLAEWLEELKWYKELEEQDRLLVKVYEIVVSSRCEDCGHAEYRIVRTWVLPGQSEREGFYKTKEEAKKALEGMN